MPALRFLPLLLISVSLLPLTACSKATDKKSAAAPAVSTLTPVAQQPEAPAWTLKTLGKKAVSLADYKGKIVVINFWATWCPPCLAELPEFAAVAKEYAPKGVEFVGISVDPLTNGEPADVASLPKHAGIAYPIVLADEAVVVKYGAFPDPTSKMSLYSPARGLAVPVTFFVDGSGKLAEAHVNMLSAEELRAKLDVLLAEAKK